MSSRASKRPYRGLQHLRRGKPPAVLFGGPTYNHQVSAQHDGCTSAMAYMLGVMGVPFLGTDPRHGNPVDLPRNELFARALGSSADVLFWLDADCAVRSDDCQPLIERLIALAATDLPFVGFPAYQRNGLLNVWTGHAQGERESPAELVGKLRAVHAMGLGAAAFNLAIYRERWPVGPWFCSTWDHSERADLSAGEFRARFISEDFWHTSQLESRCGHPPFCDGTIWIDHNDEGGTCLVKAKPLTCDESLPAPDPTVGSGETVTDS